MEAPPDTSASTFPRRPPTFTPLASTASVMSETDNQYSAYENANIGKIDNSDQHSTTWESAIPDWLGNRVPTEEDCIRSLLPDSNNSAVTIPRIQILPGTCEWLLKDEMFKNWTSEHPSSRLLWLSGFPGTGKTALMTFLLDWLRERSPVVYFFCDDEEEEQRTVTAILMSLVRQLLQQNPSFSKFVVPEVKFSRAGERKGWSAETLWEIFCKIAHDSEVKPIYCLVDALDECEETDGKKISRNEFFNMLADMYSSDSACKLRIIFSSRPYVRLRSLLTTVPVIELRQETTKQDLSHYIVSQLQKAFKNRFSDETRLKVEKHLIDEANGMFLSTSLIIKDLGNCFSEAEIDTLLETIPPSLFRYYDKMLGKIPSADRDRAKQMLMWIAYSPRPMTLEELNVALAVSAVSEAPTSLNRIKKLLSNDLKHELETRCGLFIQFRENGNEAYTVHLTHESVRNFFAGESSMQLSSSFYEKFHIPEGDAHYDMGATCITYLQFDDFSSNTVPTERSEAKEYMKKYPFLEYSAFNWWYHIRHSKYTSSTVKGFRKFEEPHAKQFTHWANLYNAVESPSNFHPTSFLPIHAASFFGLTSLVTSIINQNSGASSLVDTNGRSPLMWASQNGHKEVVTYLLERGVKVNKMDKAGGTALHVAIENGHRVLVEFLLGKGATLWDSSSRKTYDSYSGRSKCSPLIAAIRAGDVGIARLLVEKGADVTAKDKGGISPLHAAVENEHEEIVRFLLGISGVDVSAVDEKNETPLHYAVQKGNERIVKLLLARNAGVNRKNVNEETPFYHAVKNGNEEIVKLLLEKDRNANLAIGSSRTGETALYWAVVRGNKALVAWLLEKGAEVNGKYQGGETLLHKAVIKRDKEIVELLLGKDVDVNVKDGEGVTPLHNAVKAGNEGIVRLLLDKGADVNVVFENRIWWGFLSTRETSLYNAVKNGNDDIVKLLLARGADVNVINGNGAVAETALHRAVDIENKEVIVWLLEKSARINGKNGRGKTPLHGAVEKGNEEIVRLLLGSGADVNAADGTGETALHWAVRNGQKKILKLLTEKGVVANHNGAKALILAILQKEKEMVKILLEKGVKVNEKDKDGETALNKAVEKMAKDIVELLLQNGAEVNATNGKGQTAFHSAVKMGNNEMIRLLLDYGADVNMVNEGETALHLAVSQGNEEVVLWLLQKGAEVTATTTNGETPLGLAGRKGYKEIAQHLVDYM